MGEHQALIKIILIVFFLGLALFVMLPGRSVRGKALQRISWLLVILMAVLAVAFPHYTTKVANLIGVGRGTDLLFYGFVVVSIGYMLLTVVHRKQTERAITGLARRVALLEAQLRDLNLLNEHPPEGDETPSYDQGDSGRRP